MTQNIHRATNKIITEMTQEQGFNFLSILLTPLNLSRVNDVSVFILLEQLRLYLLLKVSKQHLLKPEADCVTTVNNILKFA